MDRLTVGIKALLPHGDSLCNNVMELVIFYIKQVNT